MKIKAVKRKKYPFSKITSFVEDNHGNKLHEIKTNKAETDRIHDAYSLTGGHGGWLRNYADDKLIKERFLLESKSDKHRKKKKTQQKEPVIN